MAAKKYLVIALIWSVSLGAQASTIRTSVFKEIVGFGDYAYLDNGILKGEVVSVFDCVANQLDTLVDFHIAPAKRGIHEIRAGQADLLLPLPVVENVDHRWDEDLVFSEVLHPGYWLLVHRADEVVNLEPPFDGVVLGMHYRANYHELFDGVEKVQVNRHFQLYRLLISDRVNLISTFQPWAAEDVESYEGVKLTAHEYRKSPFRVGISRTSSWSKGEDKTRLDQAIRHCRKGFRLGERNPFKVQ